MINQLEATVFSTKISLPRTKGLSRIPVFCPTRPFRDQSLSRGAWLFLERSQKEGPALLVDPEGRVTSAIVSQSQGRQGEGAVRFNREQNAQQPRARVH